MRRALALTIGFYALALVVTLAMVAAPVLAILAGSRLAFLPFVFGLTSAWLVVQCVLPARDRCRAEGLVVDADTAPGLMAAVGDAAEAMGVSRPREVRLVLTPDAYVHSGVVVVGLPFLAALSPGTLRVLIARELAQPHDFALTLRRALGRLSHDPGIFKTLRAPFRLYARHYQRATLHAWRRAAATADWRVAAVFGSTAIDTLRAETAGAAVEWDILWDEELAPALDAGLRPPLTRAFRDALPGAAHDALTVEAERHELALLSRVGGAAAQRLSPVAALPDLAAVPLDPRLGAVPELPDTAPPPRRPLPRAAQFELALRSTRRAHLRVLLRERGPLAAIWLTACGLEVILFACTATMTTLSDVMIGLALMTGVAVLLSLFTRRALQRSFVPGRVVAEGATLTIEHPELLLGPYALPLGAVSAVVVDEAPERRERFAIRPDSPWDSPVDGGDAPWGWSWEPRTAWMLPLLDTAPAPPNLLVVLDRPLPGPIVRRVRLHGPLPGETVRALALRVDDPARAEELFRELGLVRPLAVSDERFLSAA